MNTIRHSKKAAFLAAYGNCGVVRTACQAAGVARGSFYFWMKKDSGFAAAVEKAKEEFIERLEAEADRRAVEGVRRLKFHGRTGVPLIDPETRQPYVEREYSDTLLIFRLKALRPDVYRERYEVRVTDERIKAETERIVALFEARRNGDSDAA